MSGVPGPELPLVGRCSRRGFSGNPGSFGSITLPALPAGLQWDTSNLSVDGTISVISSSAPPPNLGSPVLLDATNLVLTVTGPPNAQFRVVTFTNVTEPVTNWSVLSTHNFDGAGSFTLTNFVDITEPERYFRVQP